MQNNFDLKKFLIENELTPNSRLLKEDEDYGYSGEDSDKTFEEENNEAMSRIDAALEGADYLAGQGMNYPNMSLPTVKRYTSQTTGEFILYYWEMGDVLHRLRRNIDRDEALTYIDAVINKQPLPRGFPNGYESAMYFLPDK